ncbi:hypothetical protein ACNKHW_21965 [Shigella flexneri]
MADVGVETTRKIITSLTEHAEAAVMRKRYLSCCARKWVRSWRQWTNRWRLKIKNRT